MKKRIVLLSCTIFLAIAVPVLSATRVLVVINKSSPDSVAIGEYYASKRAIPEKYICRIDCPTKEVVMTDEYIKIRNSIRSYLDTNKLKDKIDYVVTTKGVPLRSRGKNDTFSVDSMLTVMWSDYTADKISNPFFESKSHFSYANTGIYLVTRLDGYTVADCKKLVDNSIAAKSHKGLFLFDLDPSKEGNSAFKFLNDSQRDAVRILKSRAFTCKEVTDGFPGKENGLMGYYTWGSNQSKFDKDKYMNNKFYPGAIAETVVSSSGRTFNPTTGGQSLIADLIHSGVTGVKGYVFEPYATSMAQADILFDRYTSGMNLAESFYSASPFLYWMDVVIGDPLCSPYAKKK
jgi:uncharacterized protein (TIGR03790 family)